MFELTLIAVLVLYFIGLGAFGIRFFNDYEGGYINFLEFIVMSVFWPVSWTWGIT